MYVLSPINRERYGSLTVIVARCNPSTRRKRRSRERLKGVPTQGRDQFCICFAARERGNRPFLAIAKNGMWVCMVRYPLPSLSENSPPFQVVYSYSIARAYTDVNTTLKLRVASNCSFLTLLPISGSRPATCPPKPWRRRKPEGRSGVNTTPLASRCKQGVLTPGLENLKKSPRHVGWTTDLKHWELHCSLPANE